MTTLYSISSRTTVFPYFYLSIPSKITRIVQQPANNFQAPRIVPRTLFGVGIIRARKDIVYQGIMRYFFRFGYARLYSASATS